MMPVNHHPMDAEWLERYSRQILLKEVGGRGQQRLNQATVGIVGAGLMGTPLILYLAAAGVGHLVVMDTERAAPACAAVQALNPWVQTTAVDTPSSPEQTTRQMTSWTVAVLADGEPATRQRVNQGALQAGKTLLAGWPMGPLYAMATTRAGHDPRAPCLLCAEWSCATAPAPPSPDPILTRLGAGVIGSLLAMETIKSLLDNTHGLWYSALVFYPGEGRYDAMPVQKNLVCPACCDHSHA